MTITFFTENINKVRPYSASPAKQNTIYAVDMYKEKQRELIVKSDRKCAIAQLLLGKVTNKFKEVKRETKLTETSTFSNGMKVIKEETKYLSF